MIHPKQVKKVSVDGRPVESSTVRSVCVYLICYVIVFIFSYVIISLENANFETGFSSVMTCINNIGPGLAGVGPYSNFAWLSDASKLVLSFDMLAGRLELIPMLLLFHPATWKKN
jgi:trk system potassium uptake protein TrkH